MGELPKPPALDLDGAADLEPVSGEITPPAMAQTTPLTTEDALLSLEPLDPIDSGPTDPKPLPRAPETAQMPKKRGTLNPPSIAVMIPQNPDAPRDVPPPKIEGGVSNIEFGARGTPVTDEIPPPRSNEATQISTGMVREDSERTMITAETLSRGGTQVGAKRPEFSSAERTIPDLADVVIGSELGGSTDEVNTNQALDITAKTHSPGQSQAEQLADVSEVVDELSESISQLRSQMHDSLGELKSNVESVRHEQNARPPGDPQALDMLQRRFEQLEEDTDRQIRSQRAWSRFQTFLILVLLTVVAFLGLRDTSLVRGAMESLLGAESAPVAAPAPAVTAPAKPIETVPVVEEPSEVAPAPPEEDNPRRNGKRRRKRRRPR